MSHWHVRGGALPLALLLRVLTGRFMAGVYPVGMKIMATRTKADRGLGIGLLTGAIAIGTASPHLIYALGSRQDWASSCSWQLASLHWEGWRKEVRNVTDLG